MPRYHKLGNIPHKRHTVFKNGGSKIHYEQLFGTVGFEGMSSLLYHIHPPTEVKEILQKTDVSPKIHFEMMKDKTIVCNIGHFDNEIDVAIYIKKNR